MSTAYAYWKAALAGEKPDCFVEQPELGFYRKGVYHKEPNKAAKRTGWTPVAIFMGSEGTLTAIIGGATLPSTVLTDRDKINDLWTSVASYPISEEWYRAVSERGEGWPDSHEDTVAPKSDADSLLNEEGKISLRLIEAKAHLPKYKTIDSDEMASKARSLQQRFLDIRGDAKKHYDALNAPLLAEQKRIREVWFPLRDSADDHSNEIRTALGAWEDVKRQAQKRADEENRKRQEQAARDAEWAKAGNEPAPPAPETVKPNTPPPSTQIRGGAGRAASVSVAVFVTAIDEDKVFQQFKGNPELTALLTALAQKAIRAGIPVPGATTEDRSVVK